MKWKVRRFDPFGGVSRHMIEQEAKYVSREIKDYLRLSLDDLRRTLAERGEKWNQADESLHAVVSELPEREALALQCMLVRDLMYLLELYLEYARTTESEETVPISQPILSPQKEVPRAPFGEWLFSK